MHRIHQERAEAYRRAAKEILEMGYRPTQHRVWAHLGPKFAVFDPVDRKACRKACDEALGLPQSAT